MEEKSIILERRKIINNLKNHYSVSDLARIFNISRTAVYNDLGFGIRDIAVNERIFQNKEIIIKANAWSNCIIQYENYYFSNILPKMRLSKLKFDTAPKQRWMQQHGFSPFINALNERKLQNYGIKNVTKFWRYLSLKLNYEKDIWTINKQQYIDYFKNKILPEMIKKGLDPEKAPSTSWLDKNGFSVFRRMVRKKLLMTHNEFFKELGLKVWELNKWSQKISQYRGILANQIYPKMMDTGLDINYHPTHSWLRENNFRSFVAAIEHGRLKEHNISCLGDFLNTLV